MAMDFFGHQAQARKQTGWLLLCFALAVAAIVAAVYLAFWFVFMWLKTKQHQTGLVELEAAAPGLWQPQLLLWVTGGTLALVGAGTLFKIVELRGGGESVAAMLGGRPLGADAQGLAERTLLNVVQEMSIASGVPTPPVYVLESEEGINAFAAGYSPNNAVIAVTRGCLRVLNREELQGVIAHEFSHILNGDMRLNIRLIGFLNGILLIALMAQGILRSMARGGSGSRKGKGGGPIILLAILLLVIGYIGVFFAKLIKSAISRQREYLADAAAVQFTRNPAGIAGALKKIGGYGSGSRLDTPNAEATSHLFFGNGLGPSWLSFMATHPPLEERIRRIDPAFAGQFPRVHALSATERLEAQAAGAGMPETAAAFGGATSPGGRRPAIALRAVSRAAMEPSVMAGRVGAPTAEHLAYAGDLCAAIPQGLRDAVTRTEEAMDVAAALCLDPDAGKRAPQLVRLAARLPAERVSRVQGYVATLDGLDRNLRLPLADLALPALQQLSPDRFPPFRDLLYDLASADSEISLSEYALLHVLSKQVEMRVCRRRTGQTEFLSLRAAQTECEALLSALAYAGAGDAPKAGGTFNAAVLKLGTTIGVRGILPAARCGLGDVDKALDALCRLAPTQKRKLVEACITCVARDRYVTQAEAELLRAVSVALECPMPPFLPGELATVPALPPAA